MLCQMDAEQAIADLTEISSQIQAAVVFDDKGKVAGSTFADTGRAEELARAAADLLEQAESVKTGDGALSQLEAATAEGSVFVVRDGKTRIAATTASAGEARAEAATQAHDGCEEDDQRAQAEDHSAQEEARCVVTPPHSLAWQAECSPAPRSSAAARCAASESISTTTTAR
jgi:predicted regulator of Ras-like GTPase activity (Roadblock/LC7/MglB family)